MPDELLRRIGPYEVTGRLGKRGPGEIYEAVRPPLRRPFAVEVLPPELGRNPERVERFHREVQALAQIDHPHVVHVVDQGQDGDLLFFVMEPEPGSSLDVVLKQRRLSLPETLGVCEALCSGLAAAHAKQVIHGDLNPRNVLVSADLSTVKLAGFGIERVDPSSLSEGTLSTSHLSLGSLHYMAPEKARDLSTADPRSDVYSLGALLYEMLTGRLPAGRFSLPSQLNGEVPPELDSIVLKCLASNPDERYQTVGRLRADLGRLEDQLRLGLAAELRGISRSTTRIFGRSGTPGARGRRLALAGGLLLLAAVLAGAVLLLRRGATEAPSIPAAAETPRRLAEAGPQAPEAAETALWALGGRYEATKRYELAAQTFSDLGTRYPGTRYDAWWRAGQLYDRRLHDEAKAIAAYRRVPARSPHAADAEKRLARLGR